MVFSLVYFNPRSREGSDVGGVNTVYTYKHFNPRSREGSDRKQINCFLFQLVFQSTLPRRERPFAPVRAFRVTFQFQSTLPRRERHTQDFPLETVQHISIHAPAKGATFALDVLVSVFGDFNPRSREGSDILSCAVCTARSHFNPRSREGSDGTSYTNSRRHDTFQSTLPRRERPALLHRTKPT